MLRKITFAVLLFLASQLASLAQVTPFPITPLSTWSYNDRGVDLGTTWRSRTYNDASWATGRGILGFGDAFVTTTLTVGPTGGPQYNAYYFRKRFLVTNASQYDSLELNVLRDDGAVIYINGTEVLRTNMPAGAINYSTSASSTVSGADEGVYFTFKIAASVLRNDTNIIAVQLHQRGGTSSDLSFDLELKPFVKPVISNVSNIPFAAGTGWSYADATIPTIPNNWADTSFNDNGFWRGLAPLGYGGYTVASRLDFGTDQNNKQIAYFFRKKAVVVNRSALTDTLIMNVLVDDGAVIYVNNREVERINMPGGAILNNSLATTLVGTATTTIPVKIPKTYFNRDTNIIAVRVHQVGVTSSDIVFDADLQFQQRVTPYTPCSPTDDHISCFTSVTPRAQTQQLEIPSSHAFQYLFRQGERYTKGPGTVPGNHDFTGFIPKNGSSREGWLAVNHENSPGGVSILDIRFDSLAGRWIKDTTQAVDFSRVVLTGRNCSGGVTPWGTVVTAEETGRATGDANNDGYADTGWLVEIDPKTKRVRDYGTGTEQKLWAMGRMSHENVVFAKDSLTAYYGEDNSPGQMYKFVADIKGDFRFGTLYALKLDGFSNGAPTQPTGSWVLIPNSTQAERNTTFSLANSLGCTGFNGVEDAEIGTDGYIYFTAKGANRTYRFKDDGMLVSDFITFVGNATYAINTGTTTVNEAWGSGNDNLDFDNRGNLWVLQDGSRNHVWVVRPNHTQARPNVELFATTPAGSEPTGSTFTPDFRYMFLSIQHPSSGNTLQRADAVGQSLAYNVNTTVVIAKKPYLGARPVSNIKGLVSDQQLSAYPNPFSSSTTLRFDAPAAGKVTTEIYDASGKKVANIFEGVAAQGINTWAFTPAEFNLGAGLYLARVSYQGKVLTTRLSVQ